MALLIIVPTACVGHIDVRTAHDVLWPNYTEKLPALEAFAVGQLRMYAEEIR